MPGFTSLVLVMATAAIGLGLTAVTASVALPAARSQQDAPGRGQLYMAGGMVPEVDLRSPNAALTRASAWPGNPSIMPRSAALPRVSAAGPWTSPLYPQNGVTLWDRIRVSSHRDRRAFLLGTAIRAHARATAATPGPRFALPPPQRMD